MNDNIMTETTQSCCGVQEIIGIIEQEKASDTIAQLCDENSSDRYDTKRGGYFPSPINFTAHLIFTGVVGYIGKSKAKVTPTYCQNLKRYIEKEGLGSVVESKPAPNRHNHPDHILKAYIWTPDNKGLTKWWKQNKGKFKDEDDRGIW